MEFDPCQIHNLSQRLSHISNNNNNIKELPLVHGSDAFMC